MELSNPKKFMIFGGAAAIILGAVYLYSSSQNHENYAVGKIFQDCDECPSMIVVPAGSFMMGSPETEKGRLLDREGPRHEVNIKKAFAVGRFEITVVQFRAFLSNAPYDIGGKCFSSWIRGDFEAKSRFSFEYPGFKQKEDHPAVCVSWDDALAYTEWLSKEAGKNYRLLSESEWEYVARAGTDSPYWWGGEISVENANYIKAHLNKNLSDPQAIQENITLPVDSFSPNKFGLFNTQGNVSEWTQDCWHKNYEGHPNDGSSWLIANGGECKWRTARGATWSGQEKHLRSAYRGRAGTKIRMVGAGFRVARDLE